VCALYVPSQFKVHALATVLTDAAIRKFRPGATRRFIRDAGAQSLYLVIAPDGARSFMMRFRLPGRRPAKMVIGSFDMSGHEPEGDPQIGTPLTLAGARRLAAEIHRQRAQGRDVFAEHKQRKQQQRTEQQHRSANTFAACARSFIIEHARPNVRRWSEVARRLGLQPDDLEPIADGLVARWGDRSVRDITAHDVWSVIDEARRIAVPGIAPRSPGLSESRPRDLHSALGGMFGWLQRHRRIEQSPLTGLHRPEPPEARERVLSADEIRLFWSACGEIGGWFGTIFRLLLLTGQRLREVSDMRRSEIEGDLWRIPGSRTKNRRPHVVPLSPMAQKLIDAAGDRQIVFSATGTTAPSGFSQAKRRLDAEMLAANRGEPIPEWVLHDLRRSAVTGMAELGVRTDVIELVVNHISGARAGVAGVYNKSELLDERRQALSRWADHIERLVRGGGEKVVRLR
jgi:integrase